MVKIGSVTAEIFLIWTNVARANVAWTSRTVGICSLVELWLSWGLTLSQITQKYPDYKLCINISLQIYWNKFLNQTGKHDWWLLVFGSAHSILGVNCYKLLNVHIREIIFIVFIILWKFKAPAKWSIVQKIVQKN